MMWHTFGIILSVAIERTGENYFHLCTKYESVLPARTQYHGHTLFEYPISVSELLVRFVFVRSSGRWGWILRLFVQHMFVRVNAFGSTAMTAMTITMMHVHQFVCTILQFVPIQKTQSRDTQQCGLPYILMCVHVHNNIVDCCRSIAQIATITITDIVRCSSHICQMAICPNNRACKRARRNNTAEYA